ncbi:MAG: DUF1667 domain-containing protein [Ruminococcaceae bacterium]|nr:DUF1667 domain-containing protein [Oscillospiraceae bacterium]
MIRELTCIVCPKGCALKVELEGKRVIKVEGHTCKRGITYAESECTAPMRTLTTTAPVSGGGIVPVKTNKPVPKELLFACMTEVNKLRVSPDGKIGDIAAENILGTGADIVLTRNVKI